MYPSDAMNAKSLLIRIVDSPAPWAIGGLILGLALGVTTISVWILCAAFGGYIAYFKLHGDPKDETEWLLVAAGPALLVAWVVGFMIKGMFL